LFFSPNVLVVVLVIFLDFDYRLADPVCNPEIEDSGKQSDSLLWETEIRR
jgi:hypothetical protein